MQANEFDEQIREKLEHAEFAYKPQQWETLARQLSIVEEPKKKRGFIWWAKQSSIAAAILLSAAVGIKWLAGDNKPSQTIAQNNPNITKPSVQAAPLYDSKINDQPTQLLAANTEQRQPASGTTTSYKKHTKAAAAIQGTKATYASTENPANTTTVATQLTEPTVTNGFSGTAIEPEATNQDVQPAAAEKKKKYIPNMADHIALAEPAKINTGKTAISFTGGVNYGSLNAGYMVGINAQKSVSKKVFIEGNMGIVNNNNVQYLASVKGSPSPTPPNNGFGSADAGGGKTSGLTEGATTMTTINPANLYYLQMTPSVGYNVYKGLSVSFGADFQQLLQNGTNEETASLALNTTSDAKYIPTFDVGVTGKTEYMLTKRLKAGIAYRNGINSILKSKQYLDRNYLQIQLKYTIIY